MKKLIAVILVIMLACGAVSAATADATLKRPNYDTGRTTIRWDVSGNDPGSFQVSLKPIHGSANQATRDVGTTSAHQITTTECLPGVTYEFTLKDGSGNELDRQTFTMDEPVTFEDGKLKHNSVKITMEFRKTTDGQKFTKLKGLKAQDILDGLSDSTYYGIKYTMRMPQLAKDRSFFVTLAFESPDGYLYVEQATDITFQRVNRGYQTLWWNLAGYLFFIDMYLHTFEIPAGEYKIHLYWEGMWVNTSTFRVS